VKVLFLTNNALTTPLSDWLTARVDVVIWQEKLSPSDVSAIRPDLVVSYSYRHFIKADVLALLPNRFVNMHIAFLPYNRGADPNAWSLLENTPKGVTIHLTYPGIDTGPILVQKALDFDEERETLASSYEILQQEIQALFKEHWIGLRDCTIRAVPQIGDGTYHVTAQFDEIKKDLMGKEGWDVPIPLFKERYRLYKLRS
jgi:methionyl-tRNA formyltransferase